MDIEQLRQRWNVAWDASHPRQKEAFDNALLAMQAPAYQLKEIQERAKGTLTDKGVRSELRDKLKSKVLPRLKRDTEETVKARSAIKEERDALGTIKVDPADFAAALRRQEARQLMRGKSVAEQMAILLSADQRFLVEAVLEMPPEFSGVPAVEWNRARGHYVNTHFADRVAELDQYDEALSAAAMATKVAEKAILSEAGLSAHEARQWFDAA